MYYRATEHGVVVDNGQRGHFIPTNGVYSADDVEAELNQMREEVKDDWSKRPIEERYRWAYDDLCRRIMQMRKRNGEVCPPTRDVEAFAAGIVERVYQQTLYEES